MILRAARIAALWAVAATALSAQDALDAEVRARIDAALALPEPRVEAEAVERAAALAAKGLEPLFDELGRRLAEDGAGEVRLVALRRLTSALCRRRGDQREALALLSAIPEARRNVADLLAAAELHDALGEDAEARKGYEAVLAHEVDDGLRQRLLLRLALLPEPGPRPGARPAARPQAKAEGASALARFAKRPELSQELRNQAAIVLALLDHFDEAVDLYDAGADEPEAGEGGARYRAEIRLAEWGLQGARYPTAQAHAWTAVEVARGARDRRYALAILVETYRRPGELDALIGRFAATEGLSPEAKECWIDLLRETGKVDEALRLFRASAGGSFTVDMRRQLLEMCRETGQDDVLVEAYRGLIEAQPRFIEWREGLARFHQERGDTKAARAAWQGYEAVTQDPRYLMAAAASARSLGLDELAVRLARACGRQEGQERQALLFLFELYRDRGRIDEARGALEELDREAPPEDASRLELADAWSRIGDDLAAVKVLEALVAAGGERAAPDTRMKLALMLSEVGQEDRALEHWLALWREIQSIPRRRYVEERLMTVASRLGKLAGIAVELERKLARGEADEREAGLLVRLYVRVKDPVSATEILEEYMKRTDRAQAEVLQEKARIFLSCQDYHDYERTIRELIEVDPEGRADYLRQLAMSAMERGQREEARGILVELQGVEADSMHDEFEAGVLAMAGMREEALHVYRRGLARNPDRIDAWLLLSNLQKELGRHERSAGMFQHLAATADKDDLFTIAVDGILNMRDGRGNRGAPDRLVRWTRRVVLERIASRPDKLYLYRLVADLSEELDDSAMAIRALAAALPIAGEQRTPLLRELMELARKRASGGRRPTMTLIRRPGMPQPPRKDVDKDLLDFGRRILGQGELVPPQVYLDLGEAFLQAEEVVNAQRTFQLMASLPEFAELRRRIARSFEDAGYPAEALRVYQRILTVEGQDLSLILKVGELFEQVGRLDDARELYARGVELWLSRTPLSRTGKVDEEPVARPGQPIPYSFARNTEEGERARPWFEAGLRATLGEGEAADAWFAAQDRALAADLAQVLEGRGEGDVAADRLSRHPRLQRRAALFRALALAAERIREVDARDRALCEAFPGDATLLEAGVRARLGWGFDRSARDLVVACAGDDDVGRRLRLLVGAAELAEAGRLTIAEVATRLLPTAMLEGEDRARRLLLRTDLARVEAEDAEHLPLLVAWAARAGEPDLALGFARHWLRALGKGGGNLYGAIDSMLRTCRRALDDGRYRSLVLDLLDRVVEDPRKYSRFAQSLPQLRPLLGFDRLERAQVERLLQSRLDSGDQYLYGLEQLFRYLAPEERGPVLREHWSRFPKSQRAMFLLRLVAVLEVPVDEGLGAFLERGFASALAEADNKDMFSYYVGQLEDAVANADLVLAFYRALHDAGVGGPAVEAYKASFLLRAGREEEAWAAIAPVFEAVVTMGRPTSTDQHRLNSAWYQLLNRVGEGGLDHLLALCDAREQRAGKTRDLWRLRVDLVTRFGRPDRQEEVLRAAIAACPDEPLFEVRLHGLLRARDRDGEVLAALEKRLAAKPDDEAVRRQLIASYKRLRHPLRVAELEAGLPGKKAAAADADTGAAHRRPRQPPATVALVAEAWKAGRHDDAAGEYHRLWRSYSQLDSPYSYRMPATARRFVWPKDKEEPRPSEPVAPPRGGCPSSSRPTGSRPGRWPPRRPRRRAGGGRGRGGGEEGGGAADGRGGARGRAGGAPRADAPAPLRRPGRLRPPRHARPRRGPRREPRRRGRGPRPARRPAGPGARRPARSGRLGPPVGPARAGRPRAGGAARAGPRRHAAPGRRPRPRGPAPARRPVRPGRQRRQGRRALRRQRPGHGLAHERLPGQRPGPADGGPPRPRRAAAHRDAPAPARHRRPRRVLPRQLRRARAPGLGPLRARRRAPRPRRSDPHPRDHPGPAARAAGLPRRGPPAGPRRPGRRGPRLPRGRAVQAHAAARPAVPGLPQLLRALRLLHDARRGLAVRQGLRRLRRRRGLVLGRRGQGPGVDGGRAPRPAPGAGARGRPRPAPARAGARRGGPRAARPAAGRSQRARPDLARRPHPGDRPGGPRARARARPAPALGPAAGPRRRGPRARRRAPRAGGGPGAGRRGPRVDARARGPGRAGRLRRPGRRAGRGRRAARPRRQGPGPRGRGPRRGRGLARRRDALTELELALGVDDVAVDRDARGLEPVVERVLAGQGVLGLAQHLDRHAQRADDVAAGRRGVVLEVLEVDAAGPGVGGRVEPEVRQLDALVEAVPGLDRREAADRRVDVAEDLARVLVGGREHLVPAPLLVDDRGEHGGELGRLELVERALEDQLGDLDLVAVDLPRDAGPRQDPLLGVEVAGLLEHGELAQDPGRLLGLGLVALFCDPFWARK
ncbi:MAG: hypothetical protein R3F30_03610 [Planctomycetota bacterium]